MIDLSNMPPCFSSLFLHLQLANYVARIWKLTLCASLSLPDITDRGLDEDGRIKWIQQSFPDDITELLIFDNDIDDDSENTFEDYAVISRVIVKKMKAGTRSKYFFLICVVNVLVYEKMSFCKTILII